VNLHLHLTQLSVAENLGLSIRVYTSFYDVCKDYSPRMVSITCFIFEQTVPLVLQFFELQGLKILAGFSFTFVTHF
jgi:hypothetical protein